MKTFHFVLALTIAALGFAGCESAHQSDPTTDIQFVQVATVQSAGPSERGISASRCPGNAPSGSGSGVHIADYNDDHSGSRDANFEYNLGQWRSDPEEYNNRSSAWGSAEAEHYKLEQYRNTPESNHDYYDHLPLTLS